MWIRIKRIRKLFMWWKKLIEWLLMNGESCLFILEVFFLFILKGVNEIYKIN